MAAGWIPGGSWAAQRITSHPVCLNQNMIPVSHSGKYWISENPSFGDVFDSDNGCRRAIQPTTSTLDLQINSYFNDLN